MHFTALPLVRLNICFLVSSRECTREESQVPVPSPISELVWDSESNKAEVPSYSVSEDKEAFQGKPGLSHLQPDCRTSNGQASKI
jgi:hypothetical protein